MNLNVPTLLLSRPIHVPMGGLLMISITSPLLKRKSKILWDIKLLNKKEKHPETNVKHIFQSAIINCNASFNISYYPFNPIKMVFTQINIYLFAK